MNNQSNDVVLDCIIQFIQEHGYSPSIREICEMTGIKSTSSVHYRLQKLKLLGAIDMVENENRTISVKGYKYAKGE